MPASIFCETVFFSSAVKNSFRRVKLWQQASTGTLRDKPKPIQFDGQKDDAWDNRRHLHGDMEGDDPDKDRCKERQRQRDEAVRQQHHGGDHFRAGNNFHIACFHQRAHHIHDVLRWHFLGCHEVQKTV